MLRIINKVLWLVATVFLIGCGGDCRYGDEQSVRRAVEAQMVLYPKSTLQDLYKSFFQAEFGPEHMISDTLSVGIYLDEELKEKDESSVLFEPIGTDSAYVRVHLRAVQEGVITRDELMEWFVSSAHGVVKAEIEAWRDRWHYICGVIGDMDIDLPHYEQDCEMIDSILSNGGYAVHHSREFAEAYRPHYRIVRRAELVVRGKV